MKAPAILFQCIPGLLPNQRASNCASVVSERDLNVPSPAVEIIPSKSQNSHPYKYASENIDVQSLNFFKGRISTDMTPSKTDGSLKYLESSMNLVNVLKHEIRDGQLSFRGKRILELSCGPGLAGTFAGLKGASTVHFQDSSAETIRLKTIPNVLSNLEQMRARLSEPPSPHPSKPDTWTYLSESPVTPSHQQLKPDTRFFAGDFEEVHTVLSLVDLNYGSSFSDDDFMKENINNGLKKRSRKLSGSQAWERGNEIDAIGGYDVILISYLNSSFGSLRNLHALITKCLRPPYGIIYLAAKKNLVRQLRVLLDEEGLLGAHFIAELADREIWKFFFK